MNMMLRLISCFMLLMTGTVFAENSTEKVVVYTDIAGDMLHAGHMAFFQKARAFGDYLIVGVLADDVIEGYKRCPIMTLEERVAMVEACKYVDEVIVAPPLQLTEQMIEDLNIKYLVRGDDYSPELLEDHYSLVIKKGMLRLVPYTQGISSSNIIQRIVDRCEAGEF